MIFVTIWFVRLPMRLLTFPAAVTDILTPGAFPHTPPCQTILTAKAPLVIFTHWVLRDLAHSHVRKLPILPVHIGAQLAFTCLGSAGGYYYAGDLWLRSLDAICQRYLCDFDSRSLAHFAVLAAFLLQFIRMLAAHNRDSLVDVVG